MKIAAQTRQVIDGVTMTLTKEEAGQMHELMRLARKQMFREMPDFMLIPRRFMPESINQLEAMAKDISAQITEALKAK